MSIIFFGTPFFAVPSLTALINAGKDVRLVVTQPDRVQGRGRRLIYSPVKDTALKENIPLLQPETLRDANVNRLISDLSPEFLIVVAYGKILPQSLLTVPRKGAVNVHASLLPKYRGAAPIQWALINGEALTGVTTMMMDAGLDTGHTLLMEETVISDDDNAMTLSKRLSEIGARLLVKTLEGLEKDMIKPAAQPEGATYAPPITREQGRINWQGSAAEIASLIRGLYLWPNAYTHLGKERIKLFAGRVVEGSGLPGRIEALSEGRLLVGTGKGLLAIEELQPEGKKKMLCRDFLSGRFIRLKDDYFA